ncbi:hypothetical protein BTE77_17930 [Ensifer adhaerens]|nr:hypothetical protein BTE77_17930 [Ensifer adhaerens]
MHRGCGGGNVGKDGNNVVECSGRVPPSIPKTALEVEHGAAGIDDICAATNEPPDFWQYVPSIRDEAFFGHRPTTRE